MNTPSPVAAVRAALAADHAHADPAIWITRLPDADVLDRAAALEAEGPRGRPLWGVPFAVKDNIDVAGVPTTAACPGYAYTPSVHAPAVERLLEAGAVLLGKTNLDQFATGLVGVRSPYGVPRNVFDPARVPGGSSSGSGCVVAAGIVPFALGTDTAGSGRVPAMFGNIVGLKPTIGSISARGMVPACRSIDTTSVFARSVDEAMAVARVLAAPDEADPYSRTAPMPRICAGERIRPSGSLASPPPGARPSRPASTRRRPPAWRRRRWTSHRCCRSPACCMTGRGWRSGARRCARCWTRRSWCTPRCVAILLAGLDRRTVDAFDAFHQLALARRFARQLFRDYDVLLLPTAPGTPMLSDLAADPVGPNSRLGTWTNFVNLCDLAAWAVPAGMGADGVPAGVTLVGPAWSEGRMAALADRLHRQTTATVGATSTPLPPPAVADPVGPDETALFCVGAHMAGLPLNGQITALGGRFVAEATTRPAYRLYALGNRPGLVASHGGAAIVGEVWALPTASIGALLAQVPPPLGFGTVMMETGPCLGFLAEAAGIAGAQDITHLGGWRAHLAAADTADFIRSGARLMRLPIDPAWEEGVAFHLRTILSQAAVLTDPALPDALDPAPVYRA